MMNFYLTWISIEYYFWDGRAQPYQKRTLKFNLYLGRAYALHSSAELNNVYTFGFRIFLWFYGRAGTCTYQGNDICVGLMCLSWKPWLPFVLIWKCWLWVVYLPSSITSTNAPHTDVYNSWNTWNKAHGSTLVETCIWSVLSKLI